ncbi:hypothetical protein [Sphingobacterium sp. LRF_L2]|uniref:hypothetical protein n=1 Tax=Sphingobacterium sp. LRF_L2 TaxID=3369421 RepID=UPI003F5FAA75
MAGSQIEALNRLAETKFNLLILDMILPLRAGDNALEPDGGQNVIDELDTNYLDYLMPDHIIALTEYEDAKSKFENYNIEVVTFKFDNKNLAWETGVLRTLGRLIRKDVKIIYCEGKNHELLGLLKLNGYSFIGKNDCRAVFQCAIHEKHNLALRDKDFLTSKEVQTLKSKHPNYLVIDMYCFENLLFHPDNIFEAYPEFPKDLYIKDLISQKKAKIFNIVQDYKMARKGYEEFKDQINGIKEDANFETDIVNALQSDEVEMFYPYLDMAGKKDKAFNKSYNKSFLQKYNLSKESLVDTDWFKSKIVSILPKI